jgi:hypothetical protein
VIGTSIACLRGVVLACDGSRRCANRAMSPRRSKSRDGSNTYVQENKA